MIPWSLTSRYVSILLASETEARIFGSVKKRIVSMGNSLMAKTFLQQAEKNLPSQLSTCFHPRICIFKNANAEMKYYAIYLGRASLIASLILVIEILVGSTPLGLAPPFSKELVALSRSEEHTSELQSHVNLVCRLLLEKR